MRNLTVYQELAEANPSDELKAIMLANHLLRCSVNRVAGFRRGTAKNRQGYAAIRNNDRHPHRKGK